MVKEFVEELSGKISFIIETTHIPLSDDKTVADSAVRAAGSLILSSLDAGHNIEIIDINEPKAISIPPFSDSDAILDYLARIEECDESPKAEKLFSALSLVSRYSSVCWIVSYIDDAASNAILSLLESGRIVNLYLPHQSLNYRSDKKRISAETQSMLLNKGAHIKHFTENAVIS
jgi:uncharacterized protein (DUF58 family)